MDISSDWLLIIVLLGSFILSSLFTPLMKKLALTFGILDHPNQRKIHTDPKPLLGGGAIITTFIICITFLWLTDLLPTDGRSQVLALMAGGIIIFFVGVFDDIKGISPRMKLFWQALATVAAGLILISQGVQLILFIPRVEIVAILTIIWILGITNSFNLMDNMDGLAAGIASISAILFFVIARQQGEMLIQLLALIFAGALMGFLRYNFNPASIFMGDGGSMFVGFTLAALSVMGVYVKGSLIPHLSVMIPLLILAVPIFDTASVMVIRISKKVSIFQADKNHFSHRLVNLGMSHLQAVIFIYLVAIVVGMIAVLLTTVSVYQAFIMLIHAGAIFGLIAFLMHIKKKNGT